MRASPTDWARSDRQPSDAKAAPRDRQPKEGERCATSVGPLKRRLRPAAPAACPSGSTKARTGSKSAPDQRIKNPRRATPRASHRPDLLPDTPCRIGPGQRSTTLWLAQLTQSLVPRMASARYRSLAACPLAFLLASLSWAFCRLSFSRSFFPTVFCCFAMNGPAAERSRYVQLGILSRWRQRAIAIGDDGRNTGRPVSPGQAASDTSRPGGGEARSCRLTASFWVRTPPRSAASKVRHLGWARSPKMPPGP